MFSGEAGAKTIFAVAKTLGLYDPANALQERIMREWFELGLAIRQRDHGKFLQWIAYIRKWIEFDAQADEIFALSAPRAVGLVDEDDEDADAEHISVGENGTGIEIVTSLGPSLPPALRHAQKQLPSAKRKVRDRHE
jgi:hypothetical protein